MPLFSDSPHKPGSAEDVTFRIAEDARKNDPELGKGARLFPMVSRTCSALFSNCPFFFFGASALCSPSGQ